MKLLLLMLLILPSISYAQIKYDVENMDSYINMNGDTVHALRIRCTNISDTTRILILKNIPEKTGYSKTFSDFTVHQLFCDIYTAIDPWVPYIFSLWFKAVHPHTFFDFYFLSNERIDGYEFIANKNAVVYVTKIQNIEGVENKYGWKNDYIVIPLKNR